MTDEPQHAVEVGGGYAFAQLAKAFETASTHQDAATRERAGRRIEQWAAVLRGMATGGLKVGSRVPVADLPGWATPEVIRGGFATGKAEAGGPLTDFERSIAARGGIAADRREIFRFLLSEPGQALMRDVLASGEYRVRIPEDGAMLLLTCLVARGDVSEAAGLVGALAPLSSQLRFVPGPAAKDLLPRSVVWRQTAEQTGRALARKGPNEPVEAMRETLEIWNPLADEALSLWLETRSDGRVAAAFPAGWTLKAELLLGRYAELARAHTRARKHRRPKENLAILLASLRDTLNGDLAPRRRGMLQHVVDSMVARRGKPGSDRHAALRRDQAGVAALPPHHVLARVVVHRLAAETDDAGLTAIDGLLAPIDAGEAPRFGVPVGMTIPPSVRATLRRAMAGTPEELIDAGVVPSAEVLAELIPRIGAATVAEAYTDENVGDVMAATYEAFRRRRSLLLLNLEHQVLFEELPWVAAAAHLRQRDPTTSASAATSFTRVAQLALEAFPATITPSALVSELAGLAREAGLDLPLVEELAADIFMGTFSAKFVRAAHLAAELLEGSLYARYYDIDYREVRAIDDLKSQQPGGAKTSAAFDALCLRRAGATPGEWSVAANGTILEQAQILTTHNLAAIAGPRGIGKRVALDWQGLAERAFAETAIRVQRLHNNPRPLRTVKDAAYAWRQLIFFASMGGHDTAHSVLAHTASALEHQPPHVRARLQPAITGLAAAIRGDRLDRVPGAQRLLGWTTNRHWMLETAARDPA